MKQFIIAIDSFKQLRNPNRNFIYIDKTRFMPLLLNKEDRFNPAPSPWVVERTFAWLTKARRLAKNYE